VSDLTRSSATGLAASIAVALELERLFGGWIPPNG